MLLLVLSVFWFGRQLLEKNEVRSEPRIKSRIEAVAGLRRNIYDRRLRPLAVSLPMATVLAKPRLVKIDSRRLAALAVLLDVDPQTLQRQLASRRGVEWLARHVSASTAGEIRKLAIPGIELMQEEVRFYPEAALAAHLVGFYDEGHGLCGLEYQEDAVLRGEKRVGGAAAGRPPGAHLVAAVDIDLQKKVRSQLAALMEKTGATAASAVVMDAAGGAVLALVNLPDFDPNRFWLGGEKVLVNRALEEPVAAGPFAPLFRGRGPADEQQDNRTAGGWLSAGAGVFRSFAVPEGGDDESFPSWFLEMVGPGRDPAAVPALDLLTAFSIVVNGGVRISPRFVERYYIEGVGDVDSLADRRPESLSATAAVPALFADNSRQGFADIRVAGQGSEDGGGEAKYDAVLLGYLGRQRPKTVVVSLAEAVIDPARPSALRQPAARMLAAAAVVGEVEPVTADALVVDVDRLYGKWRKKTQEKEAVPDVEGRRVMPDVTGMSLRKALQVLQQYDLRLSVQGFGQVVGQQPAAGEVLRAKSCFLQLQMGER